MEPGQFGSGRGLTLRGSLSSLLHLPRFRDQALFAVCTPVDLQVFVLPYLQTETSFEEEVGKSAVLGNDGVPGLVH